MLTIQTFKKSLGKMGERLTDKEVEKLFQLQSQFANTLFDLWQSKSRVDIAVQAKITVHKKNGDAIMLDFGFAYSYA